MSRPQCSLSAYQKHNRLYAAQLNSSHLSSEDSSDHYSSEKDLRNHAKIIKGFHAAEYELCAPNYRTVVNVFHRVSSSLY